MTTGLVALDQAGLEKYADRVEFLKGTAHIHGIVLDVLKGLLTKQPEWRFKAFRMYGGDVAGAFRVLCGGEELGSFERVYAAREYKVMIVNDRINNKRSRGTGYKTASVEKALARITKEFGSKTIPERLEEASNKSIEVVYKSYREKTSEIRGTEHSIHTMAHEFIRGPGFPLFLAYVETLADSVRTEVGTRMDKVARLKTEMLTIEKVKAQLDNQQVALVIRDNGEYIVRLGTNVVIHTDSTLPDHIRGKLGMLKLVEPEHFVTDMGCRINDEVFVIVTEKEDRDEPTSSQA